MSKCISMHGEYSDCRPDEDFICERCSALDEDALFAKVEQLSDAIDGMNDTIERVKDVVRAERQDDSTEPGNGLRRAYQQGRRDMTRVFRAAIEGP